MTGTPRLAIDEQNPWPGLGAFDEDAERFFNGRQQETAELRRLVRQAPLTVVFGASGLGKTSLLQAGLFPQLRKEHALPVYVRLQVSDRSAPLIDQVSQALRAEMRTRRIDAPPARDDEPLWEYLHRAGLELWSEHNHLVTPLFAFDQFEEVFTLGADNPEVIARLRTDLADLIENRMPASLAGLVQASEAASAGLSLDSQRYKVLLSFREDFLPAVEGWKRDVPSILRNRLRLLPMSGDQAFEAVHATAPHLANEAMARRIVGFVAAAQDEAAGPEAAGTMSELAVEPALLSLVCHGLNERRKAQKKAAFDAALLQGAGQSIVADYYQGAVADLPARVQGFIAKELITERGFRKACDVDDARSAYGIADRELRLLVDRRLLRIESYRGRERVELTHDLLTRVVREHRERQRARERTARQRRRVGLLAGVGLVLAGLVLVFFRLYRIAEGQRAVAEREARVAIAQRLASQSDAALGRFPQRALLLAVEAVRQNLLHDEPVPSSAQQSLRQALASVGGMGFGGAAAPIHSAVASPDGRWLAMIGATAVYVLDLRAAALLPPRLLGELEASDAEILEVLPPRVVFVGDGRFLVALSPPVMPKVWEMSEAGPSEVPLSWPVGSAPLVASISANGRWVACVAKDRSFVLWDLTRPGGGSNPSVLAPAAPVQLVDSRGRPLAALGIATTESLVEALFSRGGVDAFLDFDPALGKFWATEPALPIASRDGRWRVVSEDDGLHLSDLRPGGKSSIPLALGVDSRAAKVVFSAGSGALATAYERATRVWDLAREPLAAPIVLRTPVVDTDEDTDGVVGVAISPDGAWVVTASLVNRSDSNPNRKPSTSAWLWNLRLRDPAALAFGLENHEGGVGAIAMSPDGRWAATGSEGGVARLWDLSDKNPTAAPLVLRATERGIDAVSFTSDGGWLVAHAVDGGVRIWDLRGIQPATTPLRLGHDTVTLSPDSRWLLVTEGNAAHLWDFGAAHPGAPPIVLPPTASPWFSPDGHWLVTATRDTPAQLFDLTAPTNPQALRTLDAGGGEITALAISADSRWLAISRTSRDTEARLWDLKQPEAGREPLLLRHEKPIENLAMSGDSRWIVTGGSDGTLRLWNLAAKDPSVAPRDLTGHALPAWPSRFTADSRWLVSTSLEGAQLWSLGEAAEGIPPIDLGPDGKWPVDTSPDGRWLVTGDDKRWLDSSAEGRTLRLWDLRGRRPDPASRLLTDRASAYKDPTFTPDSRWLVTIDSDYSAGLWDLQARDSKAKPFLLRGHAHGVGSVVGSPDGRWLATGGVYDINDLASPEDRTVRLWRLTSKDPSADPLLLLGHERGEPSFVMTPDNRWLITVGDDATLRFWDLHAANPGAAPIIQPADAPISPLEATPLQATHDSRFVLSRGKDGSVRLWHLRLGDLLGLAQAACGRNLSLDEWNLFFQGQPYRKTFPDLPGPQAPR